MGIADRDWYRNHHAERSRGAFACRPPTRRKFLVPPTMVLCGLGAIAIFVAGIKAHAWWKEREIARAEVRAVQKFPGVVPRTDGPPARELRQSPPPTTVIQASTTQHLYKCIENGRVTYSGPIDCRGSMSAAPIEIHEPAWSAGLTEYQRDMLRSADARIARDHAAAQARFATQRSDDGAKQSECAALDQQIHLLDARARRPIAGGEQDSIRALRTQARSRQYELRC